MLLNSGEQDCVKTVKFYHLIVLPFMYTTSRVQQIVSGVQNFRASVVDRKCWFMFDIAAIPDTLKVIIRALQSQVNIELPVVNSPMQSPQQRCVLCIGYIVFTCRHTLLHRLAKNQLSPTARRRLSQPCGAPSWRKLRLQVSAQPRENWHWTSSSNSGSFIES